MKKKWIRDAIYYGIKTKTWKIMRLSAFFLFLFLSQVWAESGYSQQTKLTLKMNNARVIDVLDEIENNSEFYFLFNQKLVDVERKVDVNAKEKTIGKILTDLFVETDVRHQVKDRLIILTTEKTNFSSDLIAQQKTISGTVTDESGQPLPGVTVVIKGTTQGTVTNVDGDYSILNIPENSTLVFSFVGMRTQEITIGNQTSINVIMQVDAIGLEEVVAIGYGTREKQSMIGSISNVKADKLALQSTANVSQALQGMAAGVTVTNSNLPGTSAKIRIRGLGTINSNTPLWIVDGVPTGGVSALSPSEIESITILKDAASTAIYGARGANGVILVTTLKGKKSQAPRVKLNIRLGSLRNTKKYEQPDPMELGEIFWMQSKNSGIVPSNPIYGSGPEPVVPRYLIPSGADEVDLSMYDRISFPITESNPQGTDWYDEIYNNSGINKDYTLSVSGGSDKTTYGISFGYLDEDGMVIKTGFKRYNFRSNLTVNVNKWLEVGENFGLSHTNKWGNVVEGGINQFFSQLPRLRSIAPVRDVMGNWAPVSRLAGNINAHKNIVAALDYGKDITKKDLKVLGNAYAKVTIMEGLTLKSLYGISLNDNWYRWPLEANPEHYAPRAETELSETSGETRQWNWANTLNFNRTIKEKHNLDVLLGTEIISNYYHTMSAKRTDFLLDDEDYLVLSAGEGDMINSGSASDWSTISYFGRLHYEFSNKYLFDVTVRRDGSSRFGKNNRWGTFPAFALGWRVSNEGFMSSTKKWLDFLKLRASWGLSGNDRIGNYNGFTTYRTNLDTSYYPLTGSDTESISGFESSTFGNPDAKWETTSSINFGIDGAIFNFFNVGIDLWQRKTKDMLYPKAIPYVNGYASAPSVNVGDMENKGFDIDLGIQGEAMNNDFSYSINATITHYENKIVKLSDEENEFISSGQLRAEKGTAFPEFYGYIVDGIFQTEEEAANHAEAFGSYNAPGRLKFRDINGRDENGNLTGEPDGIINSDDRTYIGSPHPDFTTGLYINLQYKGFDVVASFYASIGNELTNSINWDSSTDRILYESWGSPYLSDNKDATMPKYELNAPQTYYFSNYYLEDASYLRLQSLQLGYNFPPKLIKKLSMSNLRVYVMGSNLFTVSGYSGLDPAVTSTSDRNMGIDFGYWPSPKRFTLGLNVQF